MEVSSQFIASRKKFNFSKNIDLLKIINLSNFFYQKSVGKSVGIYGKAC